jgi:Jacalin-like lectin domain
MMSSDAIKGNPGKTLVPEIRGGSGGGEYAWEVPYGEYIKKIEIRSGSRVDAVTFITQNGTRSPQFGGNGGGLHFLEIPDGNRICGYFGRSGSEIDKLGFYYRPWK